MKKKGIVIIFSVFAASIFLPGGYGYWTDVLTIEGEISVIEPTILAVTLVPEPTPSLIPALGEVIPAIDNAITENNPDSVEIGLPGDDRNTGTGNTNPGENDGGETANGDTAGLDIDSGVNSEVGESGQ